MVVKYMKQYLELGFQFFPFHSAPSSLALKCCYANYPTIYIISLQVFQCLLIDGENAGPEAIRNAETYVVTDEQFQSFLKQHQRVSQLVPESNTLMRDSYLILDEYVSALF